MTTIVEVNHNSGPPVSNHWNNITDVGGRLSITGAAGLNSTAFGLQVGADGTNTAVGDVAMSPPGSNEIRMRIRIDDGTFDFVGSNGNLFDLTVNGTVAAFMRIRIFKSGSILKALGFFSSDITPLGGQTVQVDLPAGENCVEFAYKRNGTGATIYLNGVQQGSVGSVSTAANTFDAIDRLDFNCHVTPSGNAGNLYFDEIVTDDNHSAALCISAASFGIITHGRGLSSLLFNQEAALTLDGQFCFFVTEDTSGGQIRYIKMNVPVKEVIATPMAEAHTDATDTDGMVTTTANADKMFMAGDDAGGGFVEKHIVSTGINTDLYSNATIVQALTASPNSDEEALIEETPGGIVRHSIDDFSASSATVSINTPSFFDVSIAALFSKIPAEVTMRDIQAWVVGFDGFASNQVAFFVQLMTGADMVASDEAITALQNAALITGVGIGR